MELTRTYSQRKPGLSQQPKLSLTNLFFAFMTASFAGSIIETVFMFLVWGEIQNRSGVVWGTFSLVWGIGAVLFSVLLRPAARRGAGSLLLHAALLGTAFEYLCACVQEALFGMKFWDYSHLPFSLSGRVNPLFTVFWSLAALIWMGCLWPGLGRGLDRVPAGLKRLCAAVLAVFMACNILVSGAALYRMAQRQEGIPASSPVEQLLDERYPDSKIQSRYPSMRYYGFPAG